MNPGSSYHHPPATPRLGRWALLFLLTVALPCGAVWAVVASFRVGAESRAARDVVLHAGGGEWQRQFEIGMGRLPVSLVKAALAFAPLEPEARAAVHSLQSADVAVFQYDGCTSGTVSRGALLGQIQREMAKRGFCPAVSVCNEEAVVGVFVPEKLPSPRRFAACVVVFHEDTLVVTTARLNLELLGELAWEHLDGSRMEPHISGLLSAAAVQH